MNDHAQIYNEFFLACHSDVVQLDLIRISHPNFTKSYSLVRNAQPSLMVTNEHGEQELFEFMPFKISGHKDAENMDYSLRITVGDIGEVFKKELDALNGDYSILPTLDYLSYRSDDLTAPMINPVSLQIKTIDRTLEGSALEASAHSLNINRTGEIYTLERFPMLKGFL